MREKMWIMDMNWSEVPVWMWVLNASITLSFIFMWVAKSYGYDLLSQILCCIWAAGSCFFVIIGMFFEYQYPREKKVKK